MHEHERRMTMELSQKATKFRKQIFGSPTELPVIEEDSEDEFQEPTQTPGCNDDEQNVISPFEEQKSSVFPKIVQAQDKLQLPQPQRSS